MDIISSWGFIEGESLKQQKLCDAENNGASNEKTKKGVIVITLSWQPLLF